MNERRLIGLALIALLAVVTGGCGSTGSGTELGFFGTYLEGSDFGEGYGGGVKLELNPIDMISIDGRVSYIEFDRDVEAVPLEVAGLLNLPLFWEHFVPYAGVGVGYYFLDHDDVDLDDEWGYFPLLGVEVGFQKFSLMAEARYILLETDVDDGIDSGKVDMEGLGINLGAIIRF